MVCSPEGLVSFRRIRRFDFDGKTELPIGVPAPAPARHTKGGGSQ
jgi:hypothetical protein